MEASLASYFDLYQFTTGRRLFALRAIEAIAAQLGYDDIADSARAAIDFNEGVRELEGEWQTTKSTTEGVRVEADRLDEVIDRTVGGFHSRLKSDIQSFPADHPLGKTARELKRKIFPEGARPIITEAFEDELSSLQAMNAKLDAMRATHVEPLGAGAIADRLVGLTDEFAQALEAPQSRPVAFSEVRAARLQGQERMLRVAAKILGKFNGENPGDAEARQKLMTPIVDQNERIADYYRRQRPVPDIDPDSGEDVPTDD
ncbi:hypothetical protein FIV42_14110 [Persicimonas caeni]|uniref:Uncharacterized protein n=1 Tax=Persicimonas caeni TaxID=2292766 RepID=A0A4Y6PVS8_PERCE|nr:hypothetical protein [Persicimonas caeni]QDG51835.1 hypothetical protein FIV42_14110 [Persicimonas caeni]QED33056.1 hypothetical protein FRD00_14105 [Persicimonas caeni]